MYILETERQVLIEVIDKKLEIFNSILNITQLQESAIKNKDIEKLENLISNKQLQIKAINDLDYKYDNYLKILKEKYNINYIKELNNTEFELNINEINDVIKLINELDKENNYNMNELFDEVKFKLKSIKTTKKISSGYYNKPVQSYGYFIDNKK